MVMNYVLLRYEILINIYLYIFVLIIFRFFNCLTTNYFFYLYKFCKILERKKNYRSILSRKFDVNDADKATANQCWKTFVPFSVTSDLPLFVITCPSRVSTTNVGIPATLYRSVRSLKRRG